MAKVAYSHETTILHRAAHHPDCRFEFTAHALEMMAERGITAADAINVLTKGQVVWIEFKDDELWRVAGLDLDGKPTKVVAAVFAEEIRIKIVTAF